MATVRRYGTQMEFLKVFNPSKQYAYCTEGNLAKLYTGEAPSLGVVTQAYGEEVTDLWIGAQLRDLANFSGAREKLNAEQYEAICGVIKNTFGYMKVTELMHFFLQFKSGRYGKFYGSVDGLAITEALQEFADERFHLIARYRREEDERADAGAKAEHERAVQGFKAARGVCHMSIGEWLNCNFPEDMTHEELALTGWLFRLGYEPKTRNEGRKWTGRDTVALIKRH